MVFLKKFIFLKKYKVYLYSIKVLFIFPDFLMKYLWTMISQVLVKIHQIRRSKRITEAWMAEKMGLSVVAYSNFETGKTKTDQKRVELAANLLGIPLKELYSEENRVYDSSENLLETLVRKDHEIAELQNNLSSARTIIESQKQTIDALKELKVIYEKQLGL